MSDFLFSTRRREPGALRRALEAYLGHVSASIDEHHGGWGSLAVARAPFDPETVVVEDDRWLSVLAGDPLVRVPEGHGRGDEPRMRAAVHRLLASADGVVWSDHLDGHFAALAVDKEMGRGTAVTDAFAFVPLFFASMKGDSADAGLVIGTHVDAVARAAGRARDVDPVSAADLAASLTCAFPHTLYADVWQMDAGSSRRFDPWGWTSDGPRVYWQPEERDAFASVREAADALREAFAAGVRASVDGLSHVGLLLSGGEDSRAVLGAVPEGVEVRAFVYADWESREVRVARAAARAYGADLAVGWRQRTHYIDGFEAVARMVGSSHLFMDVHGWGFQDALGIGEMPVVLGGLSSDSLLKSAHASPLMPGAPVPPAKAPGVRDELLRAAAERRTAFRDRLAEIRPASANEWMSLWPFTQRKHGGNVDGNRRLFRSHEAYHVTGVLNVAAWTPREWKEHRRLFHPAMRPFFAKSWHVPHAEYRFPFFGRYGSALMLPVLAAARGARALASGEVRARHRPWPRWSAVAGSERMTEKRREHPLLESPVAAILDPASIDRVDEAVRGWPALSQLILLQITYLSEKAREG
jgi:hypothetical protein